KPPEFGPILGEAIAACTEIIRSDGRDFDSGLIAVRVRTENHEARNHRVRPLEGRLTRIFDVAECGTPDLVPRLCAAFMVPIFALGQTYPDVVPSLQGLHRRGYKVAVISNT